MAYEALNNLGHSGRRVVIVLNDNGRSYAPTVSQLSQSLTTLRLNPTYTAARERLRLRLRELPAFGELAYSGVHSLTSALREMVAPHTFFEALGVRYAGPDRRPRHRAHGAGVHPRRRVGRPHRRPRAHPEGPGLRPGRGGRDPAPARRQGDQADHARERGGQLGGPGRRRLRRIRQRRHRLAGLAARDRGRRRVTPRAATYTDAFSRALLAAAEEDPRIVALTAAMPGPTGLLAFQARFPDRFFDVGIAEQHEVDRRRRAWPWPACGPSWPSTRPSCPAPSTRPTSTSACTAAPWSSCSTGPASPATTGRATTASSTWPWRCRSPA